MQLGNNEQLSIFDGLGYVYGPQAIGCSYSQGLELIA